MQNLSEAGQTIAAKILTTAQARVVAQNMQEIMHSAEVSGADHTLEELVQLIVVKCVVNGHDFSEDMVKALLLEIIAAL